MPKLQICSTLRRINPRSKTDGLPNKECYTKLYWVSMGSRMIYQIIAHYCLPSATGADTKLVLKSMLCPNLSLSACLKICSITSQKSKKILRFHQQLTRYSSKMRANLVLPYRCVSSTESPVDAFFRNPNSALQSESFAQPYRSTFTTDVKTYPRC